MQPSDRKAFLEVVVGFAELKGKQLSAPALELYWNAMQGWTIEDFRKAAAHLLQTCEFMPTPKDFNDLKKAAMGASPAVTATPLSGPGEVSNSETLTSFYAGVNYLF